MRLSCPPKIKEEIEQDAAIAISISGGKDSQQSDVPNGKHA